jgi:hypothetical protein
MRNLLEFCEALNRLRVRYDLRVAREDAVMVTTVVPGQYLEIEFFADGSVEIERFVSQGVEPADEADLDGVIRRFRS